MARIVDLQSTMIWCSRVALLVLSLMLSFVPTQMWAAERETTNMRLEDTLKADEFKSESPYPSLENLDPLRQILTNGVMDFERQSLRSSQHQTEAGYDVVAYKIRQKNQSQAMIVANLQTTESLAPRGIGLPDDRVPCVLFSLPIGEQAQISIYCDGILNEQATVSKEEAEVRVERRLASAVAFLSLAK